MLSIFKDCTKDKSKFIIILKSNCIKKKKIYFNVDKDQDIDILFDKIKELLKNEY